MEHIVGDLGLRHLEGQWSPLRVIAMVTKGRSHGLRGEGWGGGQLPWRPGPRKSESEGQEADVNSGDPGEERRA